MYGRAGEGRAEMSKLVQIDHLSGYAHFLFSFSDFTSDHVSDAVDHARRGLELDPHSYLGHWALMQSLHWSGRHEEAADVAERALAMSGRHPWSLQNLVSIYAECGKPNDARAVYQEMEVRSVREYVQPSMLMAAAACVGEMDRAVTIARRALEERDPLFVMLARTWPGYARLRTDARFIEIVRQLNLPGWTA